MEQLIQLSHSVPDTFYFWTGMLFAYLGQYKEAIKAFTQALEAGLPPILLTPLYWFEYDHLEAYKICAVPLLTQYNI